MTAIIWKQRKENAVLSGLFNPRVNTEVSPGQRIRLYGLHSCKLSGSTVNAATHEPPLERPDGREQYFISSVFLLIFVRLLLAVL